jgi:hypothetical protein
MLLKGLIAGGSSIVSLEECVDELPYRSISSIQKGRDLKERTTTNAIGGENCQFASNRRLYDFDVLICVDGRLDIFSTIDDFKTSEE